MTKLIGGRLYNRRSEMKIAGLPQRPPFMRPRIDT